MQPIHIPNDLPAAAAPARTRGLRVAIACATAGLALVYLAGFSQLEALHNGAHDARHGAALPCH